MLGRQEESLTDDLVLQGRGSLCIQDWGDAQWGKYLVLKHRRRAHRKSQVWHYAHVTTALRKLEVERRQEDSWHWLASQASQTSELQVGRETLSQKLQRD